MRQRHTSSTAAEMTLTSSINPRKHDISTERPGTSEWVAQARLSHPSTDNIQPQLPRRNRRHAYIPFHVNKNQLVLLPAPANLVAGPPQQPQSLSRVQETKRGRGGKKRKRRGEHTFHNAGRCIPEDSCHRSAGHRTPGSRWRRICAGRPHIS